MYEYFGYVHYKDGCYCSVQDKDYDTLLKKVINNFYSKYGVFIDDRELKFPDFNLIAAYFKEYDCHLFVYLYMPNYDDGVFYRVVIDV